MGKIGLGAESPAPSGDDPRQTDGLSVANHRWDVLPSSGFVGRDLRSLDHSGPTLRSARFQERPSTLVRREQEHVGATVGLSHFLTAKMPRAPREEAVKKTREEIEQIAALVADAMLKVHRALGPGLLESTYQACLAHELRCRGIEVRCEVDLPVRYGAIEVEVGCRIDMLVAECIIVENKSVQAMPPVYEAQLLTYLKLSGHQLGFLVNWNIPLIKDGIKRMVNGL